VRSRVLLPVAMVVSIAVVGVVGAASVDRTEESVATQPGFGSGPVRAGTPRTPGWAAVADAGPELTADSENACERGDAACLAVVLDEMEDRLDAQGCAHTAPFAFTYLEMTRGVFEAVLEPGFFDAPPVTAHADALFARLYFDAFDNWAAGRTEDVPAVWQIAFGAAEGGETSAAADLLLGMNAHISRDLPYVVADIAQWQSAAEAGQSDFDRVNDVIASVKSPMIDGAAARFDPSLAQLDQPLPGLTASDSVDLIGTWRDRAFDRGVRLGQASSAAERLLIEGEIEREAMAIAAMLLNADTSQPAPTSPDERDEYCTEAGA
jgi:hypothetical protein